MATPAATAFQRAFPRRELFRASARRALIWSAAASLFLIGQLFAVGLLFDLLIRRGALEVAPEDRRAVAALSTDLSVHEFPTLSAGSSEISETLAAAEEAGRREPTALSDTGILPSLWSMRGKVWSRPLAAAYRTLVIFRTNLSAMACLVVIATMLGLCRMICLTRASRHSDAAADDVAMSMRRLVHRQALRLGPGDLRESAGSQALNLFLADVDQTRNAVAETVRRQSRYPLEVAALALVALACHWQMTLMCLLPLIGAWWLVHQNRRRAEHDRKVAAGKADAELRLLAESFRTTRLVRGFSMEQWEHDQFHKHLDELRRNLAATALIGRRSTWINRVVIAVCLALVVFLVGTKILRSPDELPVAAAAIMVVAVVAMFRPLEQLRQLESMKLDASIPADRVYRYVDQIPDVSQTVGAKFLNPLSKSLRLEGITYSLGRNRKLLDRLDLRINAGETVALASFDPLETRAVAHLLPRFIDPQAGRILIDGEDTTLATLESLRAEVICVSGDDPVFTGTVVDNLICGGPFTLPDATAAAKISHAHNFIQRMPQGYETVLGQHGEQLDPGQLFRLSLARAILRNPALLIIEEPAETLDDDTKALLEDAYTRIIQNRTVIFLPSRMSTVRRASRMIFLHRGKVEAEGTQTELLRTCPLYRHWEYVNFNEFRGEVEVAQATA